MFAGGALRVVSAAVLVLAAACFLFSGFVIWLRARNAFKQRIWEDREARWTTLTLEAVVGERSVDELAARVGRGERTAFLDFLMRYARRLKGREAERVRELAAPFLSGVGPMLRDRDVLRRALAVQTLGVLGSPSEHAPLVAALGDGSPLVSMLAARALAAHAGPIHAQPILANLDRFENWGTEYVTSLLVSLGPEAAPGLRKVLEDAQRAPRVRALASDALRGLHDLEAPRSAVRVLRGDVDPDLAAPLLRLLTVLGGPDQLDVVLTPLDDPHFAVRAEAYSAFGALCSEGDEPRLALGLQDPSPWVALHAARAMRDRGWLTPLRSLAESGDRGALAAGQVLAEDGA